MIFSNQSSKCSMAFIAQIGRYNSIYKKTRNAVAYTLLFMAAIFFPVTSISAQESALEKYEYQAKQGDVVAQYNLGTMYARLQEFDKAKEWWEMAAEGNFPDAEYSLGVMYDRGQGVVQNYKKAFEWYMRAAEKDLPSAQFNLGMLYYEGLGVPRSYEKACYFFEKAALQGIADAQHNLSIAYMRGHGVNKDLVQAYKWIIISAMQGHEGAIKIRPILEKKMSTAQIEEAVNEARLLSMVHKSVILNNNLR